jgi:hypothetical protein
MKTYEQRHNILISQYNETEVLLIMAKCLTYVGWAKPVPPIPQVIAV